MSGKKKGNKKGMKMNLSDFLCDDTVGSLVKPKPPVRDEAEEEELDMFARPKKEINIAALPSAPRSARGINIDMSKIPNEPPFTAFLGNIPFDASEQEIESFFSGMQITVRIPEGKAKGHAYADFEDRKSLIEALNLDGNTLRGRALNIDVAGQSHGRPDNEMRRGGNDSRRDEYAESPADEANNWRSARSTSGDRDFPDRSNARDTGFGDRERGGFGERERSFGDGGGGRRGYGSSYNRDFERSGGDDWGRGRSSEPRDEGPKERPKLNILPPSGGSRTPTENSSSAAQYSNRPSPFGDARPVEVKASSDVPTQREDPVGSTDKVSPRPDPFGGARPVSIDKDEAPRERPKLNILPPSGPPSGDGKSNKANPFGDARPVDTKREEPVGASDNFSRPATFGQSDPSNTVPTAVQRDSSGRPKLNIAPRTKPVGSEGNPSKASSIFGDAKPVDTINKELAIEKKLTTGYSQDQSLSGGIANKENQFRESNTQGSQSPWGRPQKPVENKRTPPKKEKVEKPLPKSIDEMPKYEVPSEKIWAEKSKYDILMDEGDDHDDED